MKKIILLLFLALTVCIVSCSKDDDGKKLGQTEKPNEPEKPEEPITFIDEKLLIATWKIESKYIITPKEEELHELLQDCYRKSTLSFNDDKTCVKISCNSSDDPSEIKKIINAKWELTDNLISVTEDGKEAEIYEVIELTKDKLHLKAAKADSYGNIHHRTYKK